MSKQGKQGRLEKQGKQEEELEGGATFPPGGGGGTAAKWKRSLFINPNAPKNPGTDVRPPPGSGSATSQHVDSAFPTPSYFFIF